MTDYLPDPATINQFVLEKARVGFRLPVDSFTVRSMNFREEDLRYDLFSDMVYKLEAYVLQDKLPPKTVEKTLEITLPKTPDTWWDLFKAVKLNENKWYWRWLDRLKTPKFSVRTREVKMKVDLERWVSYPEAQNIPETFGRQYRGYNITSNIWEA